MICLSTEVPFSWSTVSISISTSQSLNAQFARSFRETATEFLVDFLQQWLWRMKWYLMIFICMLSASVSKLNVLLSFLYIHVLLNESYDCNLKFLQLRIFENSKFSEISQLFVLRVTFFQRGKRKDFFKLCKKTEEENDKIKYYTNIE